jgi:alkyl sulfatase BDS1-like metallo-beta-lactamase superfamily hydrolase
VFRPHSWDGFVSLDTPAPDTVNPSLWRQLQLLTIGGLFQVVDRVYQVRGYDLSNMSVVEGDSGLIVVDPLISVETAKAALELYYAHRPRRPVVAVVFTHSHVDHYGGVLGVADAAAVADGSVAVIAPDGFLEEAVSENVIAGNAMTRRATYMYGSLLPRGPRAQAGAGLGLAGSTGEQSLVAPNRTITATGERLVVDGVEIVFQLTPGSEAPAEMNLWLPQLGALCMAENVAATLHNVLTLRGAKVRDPLVWSRYLQESLDLFGDDAEVVFTSHHWPRWGTADIVEYLGKQRDAYKYIHDQAVRLLNLGFTIQEVGELVELPPSLAQEWYLRGYYGSVVHNAKAVYQRYLGWFDGNPSQLYQHPPRAAARRYVEFMGGADAVLAKAQASFAAGDYRWVAEVVGHVVFADPGNVRARRLQADALEQLGYQAESGPWRNVFLTGAQELRLGAPPVDGTSGVSPAVVAAMDVELLLDYLAIHLDGRRAGDRAASFDFVFTDAGETWNVVLGNGVLRQIEGSGGTVDATLRLTRQSLDSVLSGAVPFRQAVREGQIRVSGDRAEAFELFRLLDTFELFFPIVTP